MSLRLRRYISGLLDVYIPGGFLFLFIFILDEYYKVNLELNIMGGFMWGIILMKDVFNGQSFFKKLFGLKVVNKHTQEPIKPLVSIVRNFVALPIFPLEVLSFVVLGKRISDHLFATEVVDTHKAGIGSVVIELRHHSLFDYLKEFIVSCFLAILGVHLYIWIWMYLLQKYLI